MPEKALKDYTITYVREQLAGKTPQQKIDWLVALQDREEREMKESKEGAIEWERKGLGLPPAVTPLAEIDAIKKAMEKPAPAPRGSILVFSKESRDKLKPKGGRKTRRRHRTRKTRRHR